MKLSTIQRLGGGALIAGSLLLAAYATLFPALLPMEAMTSDFTRLVLDPDWVWVAEVALAGVLLMMAGFAGVYSRLWARGGWAGLLGFVFLEIAYLLQACKVSWEILLYPVMAGQPAAAFLLRDHVLWQGRPVVAFEIAASLTIVVGILLFGFALVRTREFPRSGGVLLVAGALLYGLGPLLSVIVAIGGIVIHAIGCFILGVRLMRPASGESSAAQLTV